LKRFLTLAKYKSNPAGKRSRGNIYQVPRGGEGGQLGGWTPNLGGKMGDCHEVAEETRKRLLGGHLMGKPFRNGRNSVKKNNKRGDRTLARRRKKKQNWTPFAKVRVDESN